MYKTPKIYVKQPIKTVFTGYSDSKPVHFNKKFYTTAHFNSRKNFNINEVPPHPRTHTVKKHSKQPSYDKRSNKPDSKYFVLNL